MGEGKGKKKPRERTRVKKGSLYENGARKRTPCPKCGPGVFMAQHKNREHCGRCGYTKMKQ
jgi:small subunit ribosomal protein S27Ae